MTNASMRDVPKGRTGPALCALVAAALVVTAGCGMEGMQSGGARAGREQTGEVAEGRPDLTAGDRARLEAYVAQIREKWGSDTSTDGRLDDLEKETIGAFRLALGKGTVRGAEPPMASSVSITALRASPIKLRVEPIRGDDGAAIGAGFVDLQDSYSERVRKLQRKVVEQTLSPSETAEIQGGAKYLMKVNDVRMGVHATSGVAYQANVEVALLANSNILSVQALTQIMAQLGMSNGPEDRAVVKKLLARQKRAESLAAATLGMIATYEAVINGGKNPKALDAIAESALKSMPVHVSVSDAEATAFLDAWRSAPVRTQESYERSMRARYGDADYTRFYKAGVEAMFVGAPVPGASGSARKTADGLSAKDAPGALDAAAKVFPGDGTIRHSLEGAAALARGDAKGALNAALGLVPGGGLVKDGLGLALKLLFPG